MTTTRITDVYHTAADARDALNVYHAAARDAILAADQDAHVAATAAAATATRAARADQDVAWVTYVIARAAYDDAYDAVYTAAYTAHVAAHDAAKAPGKIVT